ncbi:MAG: homocitrate synthase [Synechococcales bacterium]|nr:homocitrate synthase [Cyanobacteria bacterium REEB444]MEB3125111.1 homocitrate synthase [Synechococcales bacterium]
MYGVSPTVRINDTTLRDGEQSAGIAFGVAEKVAIARFLDGIGIHEIEVGIPVMGRDEGLAIREIVGLQLQTKLLGWNRAVIGDVQASLACGLARVHIAIPVSEIQIEAKFGGDRHQVFTRLQQTLSFALDRGLYVSVGGEDASRAEPEFLVEVAERAMDWGAQRFRFCDTVGILDPFSTFERVSFLVKHLNIPIEMHTHDDLGMATANAIAGLRAGAMSVNTTVNGLGERAGNAALEEVVMALKHLYQIDTGIITHHLPELSHLVQKATGKPIPPWKAIVGQNVFTHEAGVHADGILKNPATYAPFSPEELGMEHRLVLGKHSGTHGLKHLLNHHGIQLARDAERGLLEQIRDRAVSLHRGLTDGEVLELAAQSGVHFNN